MKYVIFFTINMLILSSSYAKTSCDSVRPYDKFLKCQLEEVDKRLNDEYGQIINSSNPEHEKMLRETQREWIKYRDKNCVHISSVKSERSHNIKYNETRCLIYMTKARASLLQGISRPLPILWRKIIPGNEWLIWSDDAKGGGPFPSKQKEQHAIAEHYLENVMAIHGDLKWMIKEEEMPFTAKPNISSIGKWNNYNVYDVIVDEKGIQLKQIVLETAPGIFKILYSLMPASKVDITPSYIIPTTEEPILASKIRVPGTGHYYYEKYFIIDPDNGLPDTLDMSAIGHTLEELLPPKYGIWKGGAFSLKNLSYISPVWKNTDANCCPTGGKVEIKFTINNGKLTPLVKNYDPDYDNQR